MVQVSVRQKDSNRKLRLQHHAWVPARLQLSADLLRKAAPDAPQSCLPGDLEAAPNTPQPDLPGDLEADNINYLDLAILE